MPATPGRTSPTDSSRRVHGRSRSFALRPQYRLRGHGLVEDSQQCVDRPRHVQIDRRRQDVDVHRPPRRGPDLDDSHSSHQSRYRLRRGARQSVHPRITDRGVYRTNDGGKTWKKILYLSDTVGAADLELQPGSPERSVRLHVVGAAQALDHHQRREGRWNLQEHRRRRHLEQARRRAAQRTLRPRQRRHLELQAESHLRADRGQARLGPLSFGRRRRDVDARQ